MKGGVSVIIEEQKALAKWHYSNKEWFISKGYVFTNFGDEFEVNYIDLMVSSKVNIFLKCDNCSEEFK